MSKDKFYSLKNILERKAQYNVIIGERSNGKTYSCLKYGLEQHAKTGKQMGIVRRWADDFKNKRGATLFDNLVQNGVLKALYGDQWTYIYFYSMRWYLARDDAETGKRVLSDDPIAYAFAISAVEHDKSSSYPNVTTVIFDEFLTREYYLDDEFVKFMNVLSTIIRHRNDVIIFMLGNTVNKYCPYFSEMGLAHIKQMEKGTIDVYTYGETDLRVAVEFSDNPAKTKASDFYFAFNNPKLHMITGGTWELDIYPHLPQKYRPADVVFIFFIIFDGETLQCEVVNTSGITFIYVHIKTTELRDPDHDLIYSTSYDPRPNWRRRITRPQLPVEKKLSELLRSDKVFYQNNEVGEIVFNYLKWCAS